MPLEQIDGKVSIWERFKCAHKCVPSVQHTHTHIHFHKSRQFHFSAHLVRSSLSLFFSFVDSNWTGCVRNIRCKVSFFHRRSTMIATKHNCMLWNALYRIYISPSASYRTFICNRKLFSVLSTSTTSKLNNLTYNRAMNHVQYKIVSHQLMQFIN